MIGSTDIPEWCAVEACGLGGIDSVNEALRLDTTRISAMYCASPIAHVQAVKAPCLVWRSARPCTHTHTHTHTHTLSLVCTHAQANWYRYLDAQIFIGKNDRYG
jgi:hypothetical protein